MSHGKKNKVTAAAEIEKTPVVIPSINSIVSDFCRELSPADSRHISEAVTEIRKDMQQMVESALAIGTRLRQMRSTLGEVVFGKFMKEVLPKIGIPTSTGYRYADKASTLADRFPNPTVRIALAKRAGDGLITYSKNKDGGTDWTKSAVSPYYVQAIKKVGEPPKGTLDEEKADTYALSVVSVARKLQKEARVPGQKNVKRDFALLVKQFDRFVNVHGLGRGDTAILAMFESALRINSKENGEQAWKDGETLIGMLEKKLDSLRSSIQTAPAATVAKAA